KKKGFKLGIVTGKSQKSLDISLKNLGMESLFDCKISGDDVTRPKPDPEGIINLLSYLDQKKHEAIFLGDREADIEAGMRAEVLTGRVQWLPNVQTTHYSTAPDAVYEQIDEFMRDSSLQS